MHPFFMGELTQYNNVHPRLPTRTWTSIHSNQVDGGPQVPSLDANQGDVNLILFDQPQTFIRVPITQNLGL